MPLAAFMFRIHNRSSRKAAVSLAAFMQNPVGYDAAGENNSCESAWFGGNVNQPLNEGAASGIYMQAVAGSEAVTQIKRLTALASIALTRTRVATKTGAFRRKSAPVLARRQASE